LCLCIWMSIVFSVWWKSSCCYSCLCLKDYISLSFLSTSAVVNCFTLFNGFDVWLKEITILSDIIYDFNSYLEPILYVQWWRSDTIWRPGWRTMHGVSCDFLDFDPLTFFYSFTHFVRNFLVVLIYAHEIPFWRPGVRPSLHHCLCLLPTTIIFSYVNMIEFYCNQITYLHEINKEIIFWIRLSYWYYYLVVFSLIFIKLLLLFYLFFVAYFISCNNHTSLWS